MKPRHKEERNDPAYQRQQGTRGIQEKKKRKLSFTTTTHIKDQGQTFEEWEAAGLSAAFFERMRYVGQFSVQEALQQKCIKQYTKVEFPPDSGFTQPRHITGVTWAVMHLTNHSKEVVAGYIEDDVFHVVFLDQEHLFWPSAKRNT